MRTHTTDKMIEYMKIHRISLVQDRDSLKDLPSKDSTYNYLTGAIVCIDHLLEYASE